MAKSISVVVPPSRGDSARFEIVGARGAAEGHVQMRVHIDTTGNHQVIRCVDYAPRIFDWEPRTYGRDFVANDADVRDACVGRGHYRAVSNHRVKTHLRAST